MTLSLLWAWHVHMSELYAGSIKVVRLCEGGEEGCVCPYCLCFKPTPHTGCWRAVARAQQPKQAMLCLFVQVTLWKESVDGVWQQVPH